MDCRRLERGFQRRSALVVDGTEGGQRSYRETTLRLFCRRHHPVGLALNEYCKTRSKSGNLQQSVSLATAGLTIPAKRVEENLANEARRLGGRCAPLSIAPFGCSDLQLVMIGGLKTRTHFSDLSFAHAIRKINEMVRF